MASDAIDREDHEKAEPILRRALAIYEASHDPHYVPVHDHIDAALRLAQVLTNTQRPEQAEQLYRRVAALAIEEATSEPDDPAMVESTLHEVA